jgi:hypothetical protein
LHSWWAGSVASLFFGLKAAVLAIVLQAVHRIASRRRPRPEKPGDDRARRAGVHRHLLFSVPFPLIVIAAGIIGFIGARTGSGAFRVGGGQGSGAAKAGQDESLLGDALPQHARPTVGRALRVSALWLALWLVPVIALYAVLGTGNVYTRYRPVLFQDGRRHLQRQGSFSVCARRRADRAENGAKPGFSRRFAVRGAQKPSFHESVSRKTNGLA